MINRLVSGLVSAEITNLKRRASGFGVQILAFSFLFLATAFVFLAVYLWLSLKMLPWQAALTVAGIIILLSCVIWLTGRAMIHGRRPGNTQYEDDARALIGQFTSAEIKPDRKQTLGLIAVSALVGLIIGRRLSK
jgi:Putative Actinobacterial Holin-X, holin superfamily III